MIQKLPAFRFQTTYEELKLGKFIKKIDELFGFQTTYEELKRLRNLSDYQRLMPRFQTTYEELKLAYGVYLGIRAYLALPDYL